MVDFEFERKNKIVSSNALWFSTTNSDVKKLSRVNFHIFILFET